MCNQVSQVKFLQCFGGMCRVLVVNILGSHNHVLFLSLGLPMSTRGNGVSVHDEAWTGSLEQMKNNRRAWRKVWQYGVIKRFHQNRNRKRKTEGEDDFVLPTTGINKSKERKGVSHLILLVGV